MNPTRVNFFTERLPAPKDGAPPEDLLAFFWHFAKQIKGALGLALFFKVLEVAADLMIPLALGYFVAPKTGGFHEHTLLLVQ